MNNLVNLEKSLSLQPVVEALRNMLKASTYIDYVIGFSGGLDSALLLIAASQLPKYNFTVVHVNHGLQDNADQWAEWSGRFANQLGFDCHVVKVMVADGNIEEQARIARYNAFSNYGDRVIVAHHLNDQLENFFTSVNRGIRFGSGLMESEKFLQSFGLMIYRPLLSIPKSVLESIAVDIDLKFIDDPMNFDKKYTRVKWRKIISLIEQDFPELPYSFYKSLERTNEDNRLLQSLLNKELSLLQAVSNKNLLDLSRWKELFNNDPLLAKQLLREWVKQRGLLINSDQLDQIVNVIYASITSKSFFELNQFGKKWLVTRYQNCLVVIDWSIIQLPQLHNDEFGYYILSTDYSQVNVNLVKYKFNNSDLEQGLLGIVYNKLTSEQRKKLGKAGITWWMRDSVPFLRILKNDKSVIDKLLFVDIKPFRF